jgi:hypothetical protein
MHGEMNNTSPNAVQRSLKAKGTAMLVLATLLLPTIGNELIALLPLHTHGCLGMLLYPNHQPKYAIQCMWEYTHIYKVHCNLCPPAHQGKP